MSTFPKMSEIIPPRVKGCAEIEHHEVSKFEAAMASMRGQYTEPGKVACLRVNGRLYMSDTIDEQRSNYHIAWNAKGDVLIAGLGLGMILHPICQRKEVISVTVVEKYQDVIDLVKDTLPDKVTVICGDIFSWEPPRTAKWDTIYFDIWADICTDNLEQIAVLHQRFKNRKRSGGWMGSWCADELKSMRRQGR